MCGNLDTADPKQAADDFPPRRLTNACRLVNVLLLCGAPPQRVIYLPCSRQTRCRTRDFRIDSTLAAPMPRWGSANRLVRSWLHGVLSSPKRHF